MGTKLPFCSLRVEEPCPPIHGTLRCLSCQRLRAQSMTHQRARRNAFPQPVVRSRRGGTIFSAARTLKGPRQTEHVFACSLSYGEMRSEVEPWAYPILGRDRHGFARSFKGLRGLRLPLVSSSG
jgi:hypothetical protein